MFFQIVIDVIRRLLETAMGIDRAACCGVAGYGGELQPLKEPMGPALCPSKTRKLRPPRPNPGRPALRRAAQCRTVPHRSAPRRPHQLPHTASPQSKIMPIERPQANGARQWPCGPLDRHYFRLGGPCGPRKCQDRHCVSRKAHVCTQNSPHTVPIAGACIKRQLCVFAHTSECSALAALH